MLLSQSVSVSGVLHLHMFLLQFLDLRLLTIRTWLWTDLIDPEGRIVYKGGMGPFGYKPDELKEFIVQNVQPQQPEAVESKGAR